MDYSARINSSGKGLLLIVDKDNVVGSVLAIKLSSHNTVVFVSHAKASLEEAIIAIPFNQTMPQIPDGMYKNIIFVWSKESVELLHPLIKKAESQNAQFFCITTREDAKEAEGEFKKIFGNGTLLILGDFFGKGVESTLQKFLFTTKTTKKITLSHMGLHLWYPVLLQDMIKKMEDVMTQEKEKKKLFLGPKHPLTALRLAHGIQKIDPTIAIDFSDKEEKKQTDVGEKGHAAFDEYDSVRKIQETYVSITGARQKDVQEIGESVFSRSPKSKKKFPWILYVAYIFFIFLSLPFFLGLASGGAGGLLLSSGLADVQKGNLVSGEQKISAARQNFSLAKDALGLSGTELSLIGKESLIGYLQKKANLGYQFSQIAEDGINLFQRVSLVLNGKTLSSKEDINQATRIARDMSLLLQEISPQDIPKEYQSTFLSLQRVLATGGNIFDEIPLVLGIGQDKTYLVLFQNNMELRPGGGFIGSYGLLKLSNGALKDFSIHNVYDADGQLQGHVEPPFAIRRYIPIVHLFLRDSNFDVDFTKNAQTAAFLLSQETGDKVDGVIGIDLETVRSALAALGSVYLPSYNETVTDKNFFTLIEKHVDRNSFPGSVQKQEFLSTFFAAFMDSFKKNKGINGKKVLGNVMNLIDEKHILAVFSDPTLQLPFSLSNLSGSLPETPASTSAVTNDFLGISEANLGVNKVNAFVTRQVEHKVEIDEKGSVIESVRLSLTNSSDGTWPGGDYRNYIRFILPAGAEVKNISLNGVTQKIVDAVTNPRIYEGKGFVVPTGLEVAKESESGKALFGFLVTVPQKSTLAITVTYTLVNKLDLTQLEQKYNLLIWKQPGITQYPYNLTISYPQSFTLLKANVALSKNSGNVQYKTTVDKDTAIDISLTQK